MPRRIIGRWLLLGVIMLMIQVWLGGITRLTGSGLSITEWKPLLGALPPTSDSEWQDLFARYQQIAQYKYLNQDFSLHDFKFIYFWEWLHRNWARLIAVAFVIPFVWFMYRRWITPDMIPKLIGLFALGLGQGLIGWIMVKSGLNDENLYVSHIRLAIHFISAMVLIAFTFLFALQLLVPDQDRVTAPGLYRWTIGLVILLTIQLVYGAFMAGLKAGTAAATWPDINGNWIPPGLEYWNWLHDKLAIHWVHRNLAYVLLVGFMIWYIMARQITESAYFRRNAKWVPWLIVSQVLLGIFTVTQADQLTRNGMGPFEYLALAHQITGMCLAMSLVWSLYVVKARKES